MFNDKENLEALRSVFSGHVSWIYCREGLGIHRALDIVARVDSELKGLGIAIVNMSPRYCQTARGGRIAGMDWSRWQIHVLERGKVLGAVAFVEARDQQELLTADEHAEWETLCAEENRRQHADDQEREMRKRAQEIEQMRHLQDKYADRRILRLTATPREWSFAGQSILFDVIQVHPTEGASKGRRVTAVGTVKKVYDDGQTLEVLVYGQTYVFNIVDNKIEREIELVTRKEKGT